MKEVVDIKIEKEVFSILNKNTDQIYFSPLDSSALFNYVGKIKKLNADHLKIESQLYYEMVPFNIIGNGTEINIYRNFRRKELIAKAIVVKRYFDQVKKEDWKIKKEIEIDNSQRTSLNIQISDKEKKFIELGYKPLSMDDKWFLYFENNQYHGIRSWTGEEVFRCNFIYKDESWTINEILVNNSWDGTSDEKINIIKSLIEAQLIRRQNLGIFD